MTTRWTIDANSSVTLNFDLTSDPTVWEDQRFFVADTFDPEQRFVDKKITVDALDVTKATVTLTNEEVELLGIGKKLYRLYYRSYTNNDEITVVKDEIRIR